MFVKEETTEKTPDADKVLASEEEMAVGTITKGCHREDHVTWTRLVAMKIM